MQTVLKNPSLPPICRIRDFALWHIFRPAADALFAGIIFVDIVPANVTSGGQFQFLKEL